MFGPFDGDLRVHLKLNLKGTGDYRPDGFVQKPGDRLMYVAEKDSPPWGPSVTLRAPLGHP